MPIASTDIVFRYSIRGGTVGNTQAWGGPGTSLGRYVSTTVIPDGGMNNLFPDITGDENAARNADYQCVFVHNTHLTLTLRGARVWVADQIAGGADVAIAVDNIAASSVGATAAQAADIATKNTAPTGVSAFSTPTDKPSAFVVGDLPPGTVRAIWIRRTATNSGATSGDGVTLRIEGDTAA